MRVRKIKESDLEELYVVYTELCGDGNLVQMKNTFKAVDKNEAYYLIGAEVDGKIVGTLMGIVCHDLAGKYKAFMTVENVIVLEAYRGKGIAKRLFEYIEKIAYEHECRYKSDQVTGFKKYLDI